MARRRKKDTEKILELVLWLIFGIPIALIAILKWIFRGLVKLGQQPTIAIKENNLQEIDQMDGLSFEYYVAELLKKNGYKQVMVTSSSGDFGVDIIAYKDNKKYAFQCKNYQSNLSVSPIQEVYSGARKYNASVCVVVTNSYFTPHAKEFAQSLNVKLWDRTELAKLMHLGKEKPTFQPSVEPSTKPSPKTFDLSNYQKNSYARKQVQIQKLISILSLVASEKAASQNEEIELKVNTKIKQGEIAMATTLGAGKYVFGVDIPEGKYNLKAISGSGGLEIQKLIDGTWEEEYMSFGVEEYNAKTYYGLSLPKNKYFEVSGNVVFEITRATMIEIE